MQFVRPTTQSSMEPTPGPSGLYEPGVMLEKISPVPGVSKRRLQCRKRKRQRSEILTSYKVPQVQEISQIDDATVTISSEQETVCILCGESFQEDWIQCHKCKEWTHENCANVKISLNT
ncbi:hypothetical protein PR048_033759 [Dryococelus australis]|uniref:PHD-type domain-containing protein n=1 Tax=Dryococelus australis TaxID=614101 RepID=A0ABQ9FZ15_9NEOP|nr:hypothetical protein PR048_033759 [Dryococelus australis]